MSKSKLTWALEAAAKGMAVFPIHWTDEDGNCSCGNTEENHRAGKHPLATMAPQGVLNATLDENQIREWWAAAPKANIGAHPGEDTVVVDLDVKNGVNGIKSIEDHLGKDLWELEAETFTVETPTGGKHLYYKTDSAFGNGVGVLDGVDTRGLNGYVLAPGSIIHGKPYFVVSDVDAAQVPADVAEILMTPRGRSEKAGEALVEWDTEPAIREASEYLGRRKPAVEGEGGDAHTFATVVRVRDYGISEDKCLELLLAGGGWNDRCDPPWDADELELKVRNGYRYAKDQAGTKGGGVLDMFEGTNALEDAMGIEIQDVDDMIFEDPAASAKGLRDHLRGTMFKGMDITKRKVRREYIIPEWLQAHGLTALLAKRSAGKTVIMMDIALRLSCNMDWHGTAMKEDVTAVYLCGEDDVGAAEQIRAWCKYHEKDLGDQFIFMPEVPNIIDAEVVKVWAETIKEEVGDSKCVVFIDTWQRAASTGAQNSDEDMQKAVHHVEQLAKNLNGPVVAAFHPPKHDGDVVMGSSVIENSTTAIWKLSQEAHQRCLEVTRIKGKGFGNRNNFDFHIEMLGEKDEFDDEMTGVLPVLIGGTQSKVVSDRKEGMMAAISNVVAQLDMDRKQTNPESGPLSVRNFTDRVNELLKEAVDTDEYGKVSQDGLWAGGLLSTLRDAGITAFSRTPLQKLITELFIDDPRGYEMEDGQVLLLDTSGMSHKFVFRASGFQDD